MYGSGDMKLRDKCLNMHCKHGREEIRNNVMVFEEMFEIESTVT